MNENDLRIKKTKAAIRKSILELLREKPLQEITVKEITDRAQCNRNTFYLHYIDKYDLLEQLCTSRLNILQQTLNQTYDHPYETTADRYTDIAVRCLDLISADLPFYEVMLKQGQNLDFAYRLRKVLVDFITDITLREGQEYKKLEVEFSASGMVGVIRYWIAHPQEYSRDEIIAELQNLIAKLGTIILK